MAGCGGGEPSGAGGDRGDGAPGGTPSGDDAGELGGPVDPTLASRGEELFRTKGCVACHTLGGGRLVGPDLAGVAGRRELPWVRAMIMSPDSMLRNDPQAKALLAEYFTPMTDMQVTAEEARALIHYLRSAGGEEGGGGG